jgi:Flp pilus assembly pilin Flp
MSFLKDETGQGAAEYILLFGGVIVIAIAALVIYRAYFAETSGLDAGTDVKQVRSNMNGDA